MSDADKDRIEGMGDQVKGRVKQGVGGVTGDRETQAQGEVDEAKGKVKQGIGDLRDKAGDAIRGE
ncbi:MAG TPA: CsbD family protein [Chloroflexota bacterium]|nr:CsbD family protein [Chloroflexota bacterium]